MYDTDELLQEVHKLRQQLNDIQRSQEVRAATVRKLEYQLTQKQAIIDTLDDAIGALAAINKQLQGEIADLKRHIRETCER